MFEIVDGRRTDAGVTGILLAHPSGELKNEIRMSAKFQNWRDLECPVCKSNKPLFTIVTV